MEMIKTPIEGTLVKIVLGAECDPETQTCRGSIELDIETQQQFIEHLDTLFEEGAFRVIVDMSLVSYIDSSGLWALFEGHKKATHKNGALVLFNTTKDVRRVLDITKMSSKIQIFNHEQDAIANLSQ